MPRNTHRSFVLAEDVRSSVSPAAARLQAAGSGAPPAPRTPAAAGGLPATRHTLRRPRPSLPSVASLQAENWRQLITRVPQTPHGAAPRAAVPPASQGKPPARPQATCRLPGPALRALGAARPGAVGQRRQRRQRRPARQRCGGERAGSAERSAASPGLPAAGAPRRAAWRGEYPDWIWCGSGRRGAGERGSRWRRRLVPPLRGAAAGRSRGPTRGWSLATPLGESLRDSHQQPAAPGETGGRRRSVSAAALGFLSLASGVF